MQISRRAWQEYIGKLSKINSKAASIMQEWVEKYGYSDVESIIRLANGLTYKYGEAASALACEMYDSIAAASGVIAPPAVPAEVMPEEYVAQAVRKTLDKAPATVPNVVGRMVKQAGADTMLQNARRDGAQFAWIPSGDTCAFCITLASRGWQYMSKKALKNGHAEHIHSNCDCEYAIRFSEKDDVAGYDPQKYADMYYGAEGNTPQDKINAMRRAQYAENKDAINERRRITYAKNKLNSSANRDIIKFTDGTDSNKYFEKQSADLVENTKVGSCFNYWSNDGSPSINRLLRGNVEAVIPEEIQNAKEAAAQMSQYIENQVLDDDIRVYRTLKASTFDRIAENGVYRDKGFTATATIFDAVENGVPYGGESVWLDITVPKGKGRGAYINGVSEWKDAEFEYLIHADAQFDILGEYRDSNNRRIVKARLKE